jgi:DNA segregation ATPase FtsK/SpoIIIE, S-DNA-T family
MLWTYAKKRLSYLVLKKELHILFLLFITAFITISLLSYRAHDPSWCYYTNANGVIVNWCGVSGAHSAAFLIYFFGMMAYAFIPFLAFAIYQLTTNRSWAQEWERLVAFFLMIITGAALISLHGFDFISPHVHGGFIGNRVFVLMHGMFDQVGAALALYTVLCATLVITTRLTVIYLMKYVGSSCVRVYRLAVKHRVAQRSYAAIKRSIPYALYPITESYSFARRLLDGSVFAGTGLDIPDDEEDCVHLSPFVTSQTADAHEPEMGALSQANDSILDEGTVNDIEEVPTTHQETRLHPSRPEKKYALPELDIFVGVADEKNDVALQHELEQRAHILEEKLERFGVQGKVVAIKRGPVVTLFEYQPEIDTKLSKILALEDDLGMALQALSIRILAPIPGKSVVGFEVANKKRRNVSFATSINSKTFQSFKGPLPLVLGEDTIGGEVIVDLAKMPHLLIAGSTGSGKSVALNSMLISLLCKRSPQELRLILIDPKRLEFAPYADIAHLLFPIITHPKKAAPILRFVVHQMEERYEAMAQVGARNIVDYNEYKKAHGEDTLPYIVVVIDELSDLMLTTGREIEDLITRLAQMARAAGIHLIVATQRPSVDVITGLIKVNFPSRISFRVTSKIDSRTILDCGGAEKLLGRGDMLFMDSSSSHMNRVHGAYVSDEEISAVVDHIRAEQQVVYHEIPEDIVTGHDLNDADDQLYQEVLAFLEEVDDISISLLQRRFRIGYNRSARLIEMLAAEGRIMPADGSKTRKIIR